MKHASNRLMAESMADALYGAEDYAANASVISIERDEAIDDAVFVQRSCPELRTETP